MINSEFWIAISDAWKKRFTQKEINVTSIVDGGGNNMDDYFEDDDSYFDSFDID